MIALYHTTLFRIPTVDNEVSTAYGEGAKGLLVVAADFDLEEDNRGKLDQILTAIKYVPDEDVKIIVIPHPTTVSIAQYIKKYNAQHAIVFGIDPAQLSLNIKKEKYVWKELENHSILLSDSLDRIKSDKSLKNQLWLSLKSKFLMPSP